MEASELLNQILQTHEPRTMICCGEVACRVAEHWANTHADATVLTLAPEDPNAQFPLAKVHDLALISNTLEHLPAVAGKTLLGQLRNAGARRIAVVVEADKSWRFGDFIALGFKRAQQSEGPPPQTLYTYDIASYNHKRQWNNADHWANPHMWDKARW